MGLAGHHLLVITKGFVVLFIGGLAMRVTKLIPEGEILAIVVVKVNVVNEMVSTGVDYRRMRNEFTYCILAY